MSEPTLPPRTYFVVFAILIALTLLTVGASFLPLGVWHAPVSAVIAAAKVVLVALFFMHLLHGSRLTWLVVGAALFWVGILLGLTLTDYFSRPWSVY